jgi:hypothetical protein
MPRSRTVSGKLAAQVLANGLIASARNLSVRPMDGESFRRPKLKKQEWQRQAWYWYDTIEVFHYGVQWVGNTLSRAKLIILQNGAPSDNEAANQALDEFFGGRDQHGEFLRQSGVHMTVAGEGFVVGKADGSGGAPEDIDTDWWIAAAIEVKNVDEETYRIEGEEISTRESLIIRLWRPHPVKRWISDSPTRPLLPILSQINELTQYVSAQADSRLAGAGILKLPTEVQFPTQVTTAEGTTAQQAGVNGFIKELAETMAAAKRNQGGAESRVPIIVQAPAEHLDKIDHLTFWSELDEHAAGLREEAIRRLALGMDMPPEALLGTGDVNHWGAWQIEDSLIKSHSEPLLALITEALTTDYLRVVLIEGGMAEEEALTFSIGADTSEMRLRPNRSKEAIELNDRGQLSDAAVRRENGFEESDAMDDAGFKRWLLTKLAQGSPDTSAVRAAAKQLGVDLGPDPAVQDVDTAREDKPLPRSLEEHPRQDIPDTRDADAASLLAAGEAALFHALTRAGNRLKSTSSAIQGLPEGTPAMDRYQYVTLTKQQLDHVLVDAWPNLERLTLPMGVQRDEFETALDNYARLLISTRQPYDREVLGRYLDRVLR